MRGSVASILPAIGRVCVRREDASIEHFTWAAVWRVFGGRIACRPVSLVLQSGVTFRAGRAQT
jgi:hypothetical protein